MNKHLALAVLKLSDSADRDEIEEALQLQIFDLRSYFLKQPVVEPLFLSRATKCAQLAEVAGLFHIDLSHSSSHIRIPLAEGNLEETLKNYEAAMANLRLQLARTMHPDLIRELAVAMVRVQRDFETRFLTLSSGEHPTSVLAADQLPTGRLIRMLSNNHDSNEIQELIARERTRILGLPKRTI